VAKVIARALVAAALAATPALAKDRLAAGDARHGEQLYKLNCRGCHGDGQATAVGRSLGAPQLRDPELLDARTDEQLIATMLKGGPSAGSPALSYLSQLDAADLVAYLRAPLPSVADVFPEAAAYTVKRYSITPSQIARAETLAGPLAEDDRVLAVFSVYGGTTPPLGPRLVAPTDNVGLDELPPKAKLGYLVFGPLPAHGGTGVLALALSPTFVVQKLVAGPRAGDLGKLPSAVMGKGGREPTSRRPFVFKDSPERAKALTRLYARAVEAAALAAKEESDRHIFDAPEQTTKAKPPPTDPSE
jgi:mono/diheme cytochrome c family protein